MKLPTLNRPHRVIARLLKAVLRRVRAVEPLWKKVREARSVLRPVWFTALLSVLITAALQVEQAKDVLVQVSTGPFFGREHLMLLASALVLAVAGWYFPRALLYVRYPRFTPKDEERKSYVFLRNWTPRLLGGLPLASLAVAALRLGLTRYALFYLVVTLLFFGLLVLRRQWLNQRRPGAADRLFDTLEEIASGQTYRALVVLVSLAGLLLLVFLNSKVRAPQLVGPLGIIMLAAAVWIAFGSVAVYLSNRYTIPSIVGILLLLTVIFSLWNDNHQVRTLADEPDAAARIAARPPLYEHLGEWLGARREGWEARTSEPFPVFVVAAEGGGIRAAFWTASVLARLEDEIPGFACHVYAVSGVSGGSLGAAVFAALLADRLAKDPDYVCDGGLHDTSPGLLAEAQKALSDDFLAPALAGWLFPDLLQRFWPIPGAGPAPSSGKPSTRGRVWHAVANRLSFPDRATYLEMAWEQGWNRAAGNDRFASDFLDLWEGQAKNGRALRDQVPSLLLNGTWVETGGRAVTSNLDIGEIAAGDLDAGEWANPFLQLTDVLAETGEAIPLSTAVHMSARFIYVSPAGTIETPAGVRRIVDGGYFENSGGLTASEIVDFLIDQCKGADCGLPVLPIALYIQNGEPPKSEVAKSRTPLVETLAPLRALLATRGARGRHSEARLKATALKGGNPFSLKEPVERFHAFSLSYGETAAIPLGWVLSEEAEGEIFNQIGGLRASGEEPDGRMRSIFRLVSEPAPHKVE